MTVKVKSKVISTSFLKIEGGRSLRRKTGEERRLVELVGDQNPGSEASPRS